MRCEIQFSEKIGLFRKAKKKIKELFRMGIFIYYIPAHNYDYLLFSISLLNNIQRIHTFSCFFFFLLQVNSVYNTYFDLYTKIQLSIGKKWFGI